MMKFIVNNGTDALKTAVNLFFTITNCQNSELKMDSTSGCVVFSSLVNRFSHTILRQHILFWQHNKYLLSFKNRIKLTQTIGLVKGDPDKWVNPEELQLDISSLEGFPLSIHQLFNPDTVNLDWKKRNSKSILTKIYLQVFLNAKGELSYLQVTM